MRLDRAIDIACKKLDKNKIKSSLLDCEILLSKAINKSREFLILNLDKEMNIENYDYFKRLINERSNGKPTAYLTGKKSFLPIHHFQDVLLNTHLHECIQRE